MSKDFNTGWVRARGGLAGLQGKLQADRGGKTTRRVQKTVFLRTHKYLSHQRVFQQ